MPESSYRDAARVDRKSAELCSALFAPAREQTIMPSFPCARKGKIAKSKIADPKLIKKFST